MQANPPTLSSVQFHTLTWWTCLLQSLASFWKPNRPNNTRRPDPDPRLRRLMERRGREIERAQASRRGIVVSFCGPADFRLPPENHKEEHKDLALPLAHEPSWRPRDSTQTIESWLSCREDDTLSDASSMPDVSSTSTTLSSSLECDETDDEAEIQELHQLLDETEFDSDPDYISPTTVGLDEILDRYSMDANVTVTGAPPHRSMSFECILLGTGTSSSVPSIDCITAHAIPGSSDRPPCRTCISTIDGSAEGKKNIRRNTSAILRMPGKEGSVTVLIDCGKNFQAAALEWFPKYGLRRIDAVLITHAHADAVNGLDDLRGWTLAGKIQPHIDLYVSQSTYQDIKQMFPYLVSKEFASGGGDIPEFVWHVCIEDGVPFEIGDTSITVTPFLVNHGRLFTKPDPVPPIEQLTLQDGQVEPLKEIITPYMCMAFRIQEDIVYISDCGAIPDKAWSALLPASGRQLPVCFLDCLHLRSHPSHFGLDQAVIAARKINAKRTYLLGFSHDVSHDEYVAIGEVIGGAEAPAEPTESVAKGLTMIGEGEPIWLRPAHDGLRIRISHDDVTDETYGQRF